MEGQPPPAVQDDWEGEGEGDGVVTAVLYLIVGNTRLHWAWVAASSPAQLPGGKEEEDGHHSRYLHWNTTHSTPDDDAPGVEKVHGIPTSFLPPSLLLHHTNPRPFRLLLAGGVVPSQQALWLRRCPHARTITTADALPSPYPGLGVDRALALRGAGEGDGWPCLVVDGGTALTFTVGDAGGQCAGGAILPGLRLSVKALAERTALLPEAALPAPGDAAVALPPMFVRATAAGIQAGVVHGALATIRAYVAAFVEGDWRQADDAAAVGEEDEAARPAVVFTGGDAPLLFAAFLTSQERAAATAITTTAKEKAPRVVLRDDLAFRGLHSLARAQGWLPPGVPPTLPPVAVLVAAGAGAGGGGGGGGATHLDAAPCEHPSP